MNREGQRIYRLDGVEIDASQICLKRDGQEQHVRQKTFQVLLYLVEHRGRVISKNELIDKIWASAAVTDNTLEQCLAELRRLLGDDSRHPRFIKTIPRAGYRFIAEVDEAADQIIEQAPITTGSLRTNHQADLSIANKTISTRASRSIIRRLVVGLAVILIATFVVGWYFIRRRSSAASSLSLTLPSAADKRPVAVMYFDNESGSSDLDWLRAGLADMIITDLSRSQTLSVLSRQQLQVLLDRGGHKESEKIQLDEALNVAQKSQARIVILGSFAKLGDRIRVDVHLHDARDGQLLTAERLVVDQPAQILTQVDLLSLKLATYLAATPDNPQPSLASVMTNNLEAYRHYSLALEQVQMYQLDDAIALLEKAVALDPQFAMAYARIGYIYAVREGRGEEAKPYLEKAFQLADRLSDKDRLYVLAWSASINHDPENAIQTYRQLLARYPLEVEAYERLGWLLCYQEKPDEALLILKQGTVIDPDRPDLYNALGDAYLYAGNQNEAQAAFERYVTLAPNDPNAYDSLGSFHQWLGHYEQAIEIYQRALRLNPESGVAIVHLGHTYFQQGRYQAALGQYRRFLQVAKTNVARARGHTLIANLYLQNGDFDRAAAAAKRVLEYYKQPALFPATPLIVAITRGDRAAVEKLKAQFMAALPAHYAFDKERGSLRGYYYTLGCLALREGKDAEAIGQFKEALRHRALLWDINSLEDCLAKAYLELGHTDEAIAEYERILKLNPNYPLVHYHLAQAYERKGQKDQAHVEYQQFLQVWKDADSDIPEVVTARKAQ